MVRKRVFDNHPINIRNVFFGKSLVVVQIKKHII